MKKVIVVPHTHWDREWYLTFDEFRMHLVEALNRVLSLLKAHPQYKFTLDGQVISLLDCLEVRPEKEEALRKYIWEGRLLIGPWYVQPDGFLVSGESLVRNLLYGTRIAREFGGAMLEGYVPDAFGHISQLPQILRGFGIGTAYVMRGADRACEKAGGADFIWKAPDGSGVFCHVMETGYCNAERLSPDPKELTRPLKHLVEARVLNHKSDPFPEFLEELSRRSRTGAILLMNGCDHLGPQEDLPEAVEELNRRYPDYRFVIGTLGDYSRLLEGARPALPEVQGEFRTSRRHPILAGVLSTRMYLKQANHRVETMLVRYAEPLAALARVLVGKDLKGFLDLAWKLLLENHAHDSICGTGIDPIHREMECRFARAETIAKGIAEKALGAIAETNVRNRGEGVTITVFNPCPWGRRDEVVAEVPAELSDGELFGPGNERVPFALVGGRLVSEKILAGVEHREKALIAFPAELPPFGFATFRLVPGKPRPASGSLFTDDRTLENEFYRVTVYQDGTFDLLDKDTGALFRGLNLLEDSGDAGDEYNYSPPEEQRVFTSKGLRGELGRAEDLPWKGSLRVKLELPLPQGLCPDRMSRSEQLVEVPVTFTISLKRGVRRVEVRAEVENRARDHRLRVAFPTGIAAEYSLADGSFWVIARPTRPPDGKDWIETPPVTHPQKAFVAVENGREGFAVFNRGLPEYEVTPEGTVYLTLLRCVGWLSRDDLSTRRGHAGPPYETPGAQSLGRHRFEYGVYTYSGTWEDSGLLQAAQEFTAPPWAVALEGMLGPRREEIFSLEPGGVVLSSVKLPMEGEGLIVRVYNPTCRGLSAELKCALSIAEVWEARLDETPGVRLELASPHLLRFPLRSGEIKTLRLRVG